MIAIDTVLSNFIGILDKARSYHKRTISGMVSSIRIVRLRSTVNRTPNTSSEKRRAPSKPVGFDFLCEQWNERGVESAFRKEPAERVWKAKSRIKSVRDWTGAQRCCHQHLAGETENAAHQRAGRNRCKFL